jgi:hypothetical protein
MLGKWDVQMINQRGSIMPPPLFDYLYREYCRARLAEMRKQLWLRPGDASDPDGAADGLQRSVCDPQTDRRADCAEQEQVADTQA